MSNALGIGPAVMVNRIVHEAATPGNHLAQVAKLRSDLESVIAAAHAKAGAVNPDAGAPPVTTGADVDRLV